jgi:hypothetical protein
MSSDTDELKTCKSERDELLEALECLLGKSMLHRLESDDDEVIAAKAAIAKATGKEDA